MYEMVFLLFSFPWSIFMIAVMTNKKWNGNIRVQSWRGDLRFFYFCSTCEVLSYVDIYSRHQQSDWRVGPGHGSGCQSPPSCCDRVPGGGQTTPGEMETHNHEILSEQEPVELRYINVKCNESENPPTQSWMKSRLRINHNFTFWIVRYCFW